MKESVLRFGPGQALIGILSRPERPAQGALPVLVPNTGLEHRVGPNRLHVHLCRALAEAGFPALRLDMSGMGDSGVTAGAVANPGADLEAAMDALEAQGLGNRFLVVGLCSGAHDAHLALRANPRAVGGAFIDGYVYATTRYFLTYFAQRAFDPLRILRRLVRFARPAAAASPEKGPGGEVDFFHQPSPAEMHRDLADFMERKLALCYVYTGQIQYKYNYAEQLLDAFPELRAYDRAEMHYLEMADHTFSRTAMRSELMAVVLRWVRRCAALGLANGAPTGDGSVRPGEQAHQPMVAAS